MTEEQSNPQGASCLCLQVSHFTTSGILANKQNIFGSAMD